jgi:hypothetical protein
LDGIEVLHTAIHPIEIEQPTFQESINLITNKTTYKLDRQTTEPLSNNDHTNLEELSFVKIFPWGINGFNKVKNIICQKLTPAAYAKVRVMGKDLRYQSVEYMFYLLAKLEENKISQTISVCSSKLKIACNETVNRIESLHIYMKSLRGYASYWNTAKADLLAFIRNLGIKNRNKHLTSFKLIEFKFKKVPLNGLSLYQLMI